MRKLDWHAIVAIIIALGVSISLILLAASEVEHVQHITEAEATVLATVLGAAIGAVATYLGGRDRGKDD